MSPLSVNGKKRPSLAEQIERLDGILDGLADGLNEAVAAAVKEAVGVAVKDAVALVLTEPLTSPELLERLRGAAPAPAPAAPAAKKQPAGPGAWSRAWTWLRGRLQQARQGCAAALRGAAAVGVGLLGWLGVVRRYRQPLLLALGVGGALALAAFFAGPWVAAAASWLAGFAAALAAQAVLALRRLLGRTVAGGQA